MNASDNGGAGSLAPENKKADDDIYRSAVELQKRKSLGADFARKCLVLTSRQSLALILSIGLNAYLGWVVAHPPVKYFATHNGRITPVYPLDKPAWSVQDVIQFGNDTLLQSFTLDFVHYRTQMNAVMPRYDDAGYKGYYNALVSSNIFAMVRDGRMNLSIAVSPGVLHSKGLLPNGSYAWTIQYPVKLQLDGQQNSKPPQNYIVELLIQQADPREKESGLDVRQTIMTNAN